MLREELAAAVDSPGIRRAGEAGERIRRLAEDVADEVRALEDALSLPAQSSIPAGRRLAALGEIWATRLEDMRAGHLRAYGKVSPGLAEVLDPRLDDLIRLLEGLAEEARGLRG